MARLIGAAIAVSVLGAFPALAQRLGAGGSGVDVSLTRVIFALLFCVALAFVAALLLKRSGGRVDLAGLRRLLPAASAPRRIDVIETRRVSQYADVCLLRCDGREYLILCAQQQQTVLREAGIGEDKP